MKLKIFAVYDSAVGAYMQPFFMQSKGQAIRSWLDACEDPKTQFNKHPADFTLFELGEYDEDAGLFTNLDAKINHGTALSLISRAKNSQSPMVPIGDVAKKIVKSVENLSERNLTQ